MKITFVISNANLSGGVRAISIYAEKLKALGHEVTVVSRPRPMPSLKKSIKSLLTGKGWPEKPNRKTHFDHATIHHHVIDAWRPMCDADIPDGDVVIATWWETAEWVSKLSDSKGTKFYFVQHHETVFNNQPNERVQATYRLPNLQKICCAKWIVDVMREEYGETDVLHVPYGVDHGIFDAPARSKQAQPTVGVMYSAAHFKGCDISLQAFKLASEKLPGLTLKTFGAVPVSNSLPLPETHVSFVLRPSQQSIRDIYASCDAWLFASRCEGFGLPVLEAMACRTPVIATPTGAGPEVVVNGVNGFMIPHENPQTMADAIVKIGSLPADGWRAMSEAAYRTSLEYDWDRSARLFESALMSSVHAR